MESTVLILAMFLYHGVGFTESDHTDSYVEITQLIMNYGYAVEIHEVITEDGYILEIHRIIGAINEKSNGTRKEKVALLMHGLIGSSATWVVAGPNQSIAFYLVDKGYDVWLGNNRGNTYSSKHVSISRKRHRFWDFSWHEMGIYDLPSTIDYVLSNTNKENLNLVCFSQGCTQTFVMGSLKPEYIEKIKLVVALAPAAFMTNLKGLLAIVSRFSHMLAIYSETMGYFPFLRSTRALRTFTSHFCKSESRFQDICILIIFLIVGPGYEELDREKLDLFLQYEPAGSSVKQLGHFLYGKYYPGTFQQYCHGSKRTVEECNSTTLSVYSLERNTYPIAIYYGSNDFLAPPEDVNELVKRLPNVVDSFLVPGKELNHYDLMFGRNIKKLVYDRAVALMEKYNQQS